MGGGGDGGAWVGVAHLPTWGTDGTVTFSPGAKKMTVPWGLPSLRARSRWRGGASKLAGQERKQACAVHMDSALCVVHPFGLRQLAAALDTGSLLPIAGAQRQDTFTACAIAVATKRPSPEQRNAHLVPEVHVTNPSRRLGALASCRQRCLCQEFKHAKCLQRRGARGMVRAVHLQTARIYPPPSRRHEPGAFCF